MDSRKCQTSTVFPAAPGDFPLLVKTQIPNGIHIMNKTTQLIIEEVADLPPELQEETLDFVRFLKTKRRPVAPQMSEQEPNGTKLALLMAEAAKKNLFADIKDPAAWQREIRKDRPLPGRE
ncbi:MAG: hypothetical protein ACU843_16050 [Gammaproteobacteria bacterium]